MTYHSFNPTDFLVLPIRAQNACLIMRKVSGAILFESFEVDPPNAKIMGTIGRVRRALPGPAISVPDETAMDPSFQRELASFLTQMDADILEDSSASTRKANSDVPEERDTADPHLITELLTAILRGLPEIGRAHV